jgi:DNA polymerase elongation subunit (family B)
MVAVVQPDYIYEFNGSGFDWPNIYAKANMYNCIDKMLEYMSIKTITKHDLESKDKYIYVTDRIKISADMADQKMVNIRLHGYLAFDLRIALMQLNSRESKSSLKFYPNPVRILCDKRLQGARRRC